jgi:hypothetical protein
LNAIFFTYNVNDEDRTRTMVIPLDTQ